MLVPRDHLKRVPAVLTAAGFRPVRVWEESQPLSGDGDCAGYAESGQAVQPLWATAHKQVEAHQEYDLPDAHRADLDHLQRVLRGEGR